MNIMVFDTETIGVEKKFTYDIGYIVLDTDTHQTLVKREFIIEQVWANKPLFSTAYYAEKTPLYIGKMRSRKALLVKWGQAVGAMIRDIKTYGITQAYAYNSNFDEGVFEFNADWYHTRNPLDNVEIFDIWGYTSQALAQNKAIDFIEWGNSKKAEMLDNLNDIDNGLTLAQLRKATVEINDLFVSDCGNYRNNADIWGKFFNGMEWDEEHTALADSEIEGQILLHAIENYGFELGQHLAVENVRKPDLPPKKLEIVHNGKSQIFEYQNKREYKTGKWKIILS